tara:strand:- start:1667 stop:1795 length:129 start_codon:yes stop_codon:yes gene_type:complete
LRHIGDPSGKWLIVAGLDFSVENSGRIKAGNQPQDGGFANTG